jgi:predicted RNA-binding Zn ribbon-like protein
MRTWSLRATTDPTPAVYGGRLCLAFANSVLWRRSTDPVDRVPDHPALVAYLHEIGLLDEVEVAGLTATATAHPVLTRRTHAEAVRLREALFRVLSASARSERQRAPQSRAKDDPASARSERQRADPAAAGPAGPDPSDVAVIEATLRRGLAELRLSPAGDGLTGAWPRPAERLDWPLWEVAGSAAALLLSDEPTWLKQCPGERCGWLFTDRSRSHSRRWCDSTMCGNRDRARRHYQRTRAAG